MKWILYSEKSRIQKIVKLLINIGYYLTLPIKQNGKKVKNVLHCQILVSTIRGKNIQISYKNNKFKITALAWNDKFELPDGCLNILHPLNPD